jgi:hypothetical protein
MRTLIPDNAGCCAAESAVKQFGAHLEFLQNQGVFGDERGLTDVLVAYIRSCFGTRAYVVVHTQRDEAFTGADLELSFETPFGWIDLLIQAKAEKSGKKFRGLRRKTRKSLQVNRLISTAKSASMFPAYFFYSRAHSRPDLFSVAVMDAYHVRDAYLADEADSNRIMFDPALVSLVEVICFPTLAGMHYRFAPMMTDERARARFAKLLRSSPGWREPDLDGLAKRMGRESVAATKVIISLAERPGGNLEGSW